ncbi:uncharacterized protein LOC127131113 [Lathyrus oleraceus]|uniref:uncharacterized protein LOC127131113 n=1 Tax=Pisum sativum TaxID=3888 RepID=UPI0021CF3280|nr:uncharacterized protein LOC127131113 [Pisum sativum]
MAFQQPSHPEHEPEPEVTSPPPKHPNPTTSEPPQTPYEPQPTHYEPQPTHSEPQPTQPPSKPTPQPKLSSQTHSDIPPPITSADPTTPTLNISLSEQVCNNFIGDTGIRLQERLAREAEERARKEVEEKAHQEELHRIREAKAKVVADAAAAEAKAKAKADTEEATRIAEEVAAKANADELTQGEYSNFGFVPLVLKTLEELQKEQQVVRARMDQHDSINVNIQNMLSQLLQRMPPPPNP